jgi:hypothetical protein
MTDQNLILALIRPVGVDNPDEVAEASAKIGIVMGERTHHIKQRAGDNLLINLLTPKSFSTSKPLPELKAEFEKVGRVAYLYEKEITTPQIIKRKALRSWGCTSCNSTIKKLEINYMSSTDSWNHYCQRCVGAIKTKKSIEPLMLGVFASEEEVKRVLG